MIKSIQPWLLLLGFVFVVLITYWITQDWNKTETVAFCLTGLVIVWYTWETQLLRVETQRQTEVQLRPFVVVEPTSEGFQTRNIGYGPAINVRIGEVLVSEIEEIIIRFPDTIPILLNDGKAIELRAESFKKGKSAGDFFLAHLDPKYANLNLSIPIEFQSVDLKTYSIEETVVPGELRIGGFK